MANEKDPITKTFCLFHQQTECSCIYPVVSTPVLIERLKHHIRLNNLLNKHEHEEAKKDARNQQTILFENRLSDLKE